MAELRSNETLVNAPGVCADATVVEAAAHAGAADARDAVGPRAAICLVAGELGVRDRRGQ